MRGVPKFPIQYDYSKLKNDCEMTTPRFGEDSI